MKHAEFKFKISLLALAVALTCAAPAFSASEVDEVNAAIAAKGAKWQAGETEMTRLSAAERAARLGIVNTPLPAGQRAAAPSLKSDLPLTSPSSLDWRDSGGNFVTGVRNQGGCGSCWAFGSTAALESKTLIEGNTPGLDLDLSEQVVVSCSGDGSCNGGYLVDDFFVTYGAPAEACYPYTATNGNCLSACADWQQGVYRTNSYTWVVPYGSQQSADTLKDALYTYGPMVVTFAVYSDFYSYISGIYSHTTGGLVGYHAVLLAGYDDGDGCFIVKNSWGTDWGEGGFFRIAYSEVTGACDFGYEALAYGDVIVHDATPWTRQMGTATYDAANAVAVDTAGNVYAAGWTYGGLDGNVNAGGKDAFVVKFDSTGNRQWTRQVGTSADDEARGVAVDTGGNVYIAGCTYGDLDGNTNSGNYDFFVVKYSTNGDKQWTRQLGTSSNDSASGVSVDTGGNVYIAGYTYGDLDGNVNVGGNDMFVVKYNSSGVKQWTKQMGTTSGDSAYGVSVDISGNVYAAGWSEGGLDGNTNAGGYDLFVVKYDTNGVKQWTRQLGTSLWDYATSVAVDAGGYLYVSGYTSGGLDGNTNAGGEDVFLTKFDQNGNGLWTKQAGSAAYDEALGVSVDGSGNVYAAGWTEGGLDGNANAGGGDLFVLKYDSLGNKQWTKQMGTSAADWATGVAVDGGGSVCVAGYTDGGLDGNANSGSTDLFVMKLVYTPPGSATLTASASSVCAGTEVAFTAGASGGSGPYEYRFWHVGPDSGWTERAAYSITGSLSWTPSSSDVGTNKVIVWARNQGSSADWEAYAYCAVTVKTPPGSAALSMFPSRPVYYSGWPVTFRASASGGTGPYEYRFILVGPANNWTITKDYSTSRVWNWIPSVSDRGTNQIIVWVRNAGSSAEYETYSASVVNVR